MEGEISSNGISLEIITQILELAYSKWQKEKRYNPTSEFNVIKVLSSYNEVLYQRNINSEKDQIYYNFIHGIGKVIPKTSTKEEWINYCQQLFLSQAQYLKSEESMNSMRSSRINMNYNNKLQLKAFIVLLKNQMYKRQKREENKETICPNNSKNSPINQQEMFIPQQDNYIQYKKNQYQKQHLNSSTSHLQNPQKEYYSHSQQDNISYPQRDNNSYSQKDNNSYSQKDNLPIQYKNSLPYSQQDNLPQTTNQIKENQYYQNKSKMSFAPSLEYNQNDPVKERKSKASSPSKSESQQEHQTYPHFESIRQMTAKETIEYQQKSTNDSFSYYNQNQSIVSPSSLPLQSTNSPHIQNKQHPNNSNNYFHQNNLKNHYNNQNINNNQNNSNQKINNQNSNSNNNHGCMKNSNQNRMNKNEEQSSYEERMKGWQDNETLSTIQDRILCSESNKNTLRNKGWGKSVKAPRQNIDAKSLINCMYDNLDIIETNVDELGENAINMSKISADFETSCISKGRNNTKFLDESYSFQQNTNPNYIFCQTGNHEEFDELSFHQQDMQSTLPHNSTLNHVKRGIKQLETTLNTKNYTSLSAGNQSNTTLQNLDFNLFQDNIQILSQCFTKLYLHKQTNQKRRYIL